MFSFLIGGIMGILRINLFGNVRVQHGNRAHEEKITHKIQGLLAYLLLQRHRTHQREVLAGLFWGDYDPERARGCLNTALWRLRQVLEPKGIPSGYYLRTNSLGEVGFNSQSEHWFDVEVFNTQTRSSLSQPVESISPADIEHLEAAIQLYTGDLLEGFYDDWALREREYMRLVYLNSLIYLMNYHKSQMAYEKSLAYGHQILALDPLREEIHRDLMRLYQASGQRSLAIHQYEVCRKTIALELGIEPMEETQTLYAQLAGGSPPQAAPAADSAGLQQVLSQLRQAGQSFEQAREQFQQALLYLERLTRGGKSG
jgi:DNA-binding SARP family transcriptional activator